MKKGLVIVVCFVLIFSMSFVSANWFGDFWKKITGNPIERGGDDIDECEGNECGDEGEEYDEEVGEEDEREERDEEGEEENEETPSCVDSDGGEDYFHKGYVYGSSEINNNLVNFIHHDNCQDSSTLIEYFCSENEEGHEGLHGVETYDFKNVTCSNVCLKGVCVEKEIRIPVVPSSNSNFKNPEKYSEKEVFLISDKDWHDVLSLVPLTTWTGEEDLCQKGYGTPDNVCVYPMLIYHEEENGFDADSIIYFMQQYNTEKVTIVGNTPKELDNLLIVSPELGAGLEKENIQRISPENYLSYWEEYEDIVYVEDDYELALLASTYASLINSPLIIFGAEFGDLIEIDEDKNFICVGDVDLDCDENYNLEELQKKYIDETKTNKIILVNPSDLNIKVEEEFQPEKSAKSISEIYGKTSLAAPILASAKHEVIVTTNSKDSVETKNTLIGFIEENPSLIENPVFSWALSSRSELEYFFVLYDLDKQESKKIKQGKVNDFSFYNNTIVWGDYKNIYIYNIITEIKKTIPIRGEDFSMYGSKLVFRNDDYENILLYDLITEQNIEIAEEGENPSIYGDKIVWSERDKVYLYDLVTKDKEMIVQVDGRVGDVEIYKDKIIVGDYREGSIFYYDIVTKNKEEIGWGFEDESNLDIYENIVVWSAFREGRMYMYDFNTGNRTLIGNVFNRDRKKQFDIYENIVVWKGANNKLNIYDVLKEERSEKDYVELPRIWENYVVGYSWENTEIEEEASLHGYLTIMASQDSIPLKQIIGYSGGYPIAKSLDANYYNFINEENLPNLVSGRIIGITLSDTSSYLARDLFYNSFTKTNNVEFMASKANGLMGMINDAKKMDKRFSEVGYNTFLDIHENEDIFYGDDSMWKNKDLISYGDHGGNNWEGIYSYRLPWLSNSLIFNYACSICSTVGKKGDSFCSTLLRKGALMSFGAVGVDTHNSVYFETINLIYYEELPIGISFAKSKSCYGVYCDSRRTTTLIGDPTLDINPPYFLNKSLGSISIEW